MLKHTSLIFILCFFGFVNGVPSRVSPIYENTLKLSYQVEVPNIAYGSGFAVGNYKNGSLFITNDHVCQNTRGPGLMKGTTFLRGPLNTMKPYVIDSKGSRWKASVIKTTGVSVKKLSKPSSDLCLLFVDNLKVPFVTISKQVAEVGEEVFSISGPQGIFPMIHKGFIGPSIDTEDPNLLPVQASSLDITHGSSGGAVFDFEGKVVGVVFALLVEQETKVGSIALVIPKDQLELFLEGYLQKQ